jgi:hypothetical protein
MSLYWNRSRFVPDDQGNLVSKNWYRSRYAPGASASTTTLKMFKINLTIEKMALKGKDSYWDFYNFINELISKNLYADFERSLYYYYGVDISQVKSIDSVKKNIWESVLFQINTPFSNKLQKIYDNEQLYQLGVNIYSNLDSKVQLTLTGPLSSTFSITGLTPSISINRIDKTFNMDFLSDKIKWVKIDRSEWSVVSGVDTPISVTALQQFYVGTQSNQVSPYESKKLEIPVEVSRQYLISTEETRTSSGSSSLYRLYYKFEVSRDSFLGEINENEIYTSLAGYLVQNREYAKLIGARKTYLEVSKKIAPLTPINPSYSTIKITTTPGFSESYIFNYDDPTYTEDYNLLVRYQQAFSYLNS